MKEITQFGMAAILIFIFYKHWSRKISEDFPIFFYFYEHTENDQNKFCYRLYIMDSILYYFYNMFQKCIIMFKRKSKCTESHLHRCGILDRNIPYNKLISCFFSIIL